MSIRVLIAEKHQLLLDGLEIMLQRERDVVVVATCSDGVRALELAEEHVPDVVVLSRRLPRMSGLAVVREMRNKGIESAVVLLASEVSELEVMDALRSGVSGVLLKTMPSRMFVQCVRKVHAGGEWVEKNSMTRALQQLLRAEQSISEHASTLSTREIDVLRAVARGLRNRQVAERLFISESTVKVHLNNIYEKLQIGSRVELSLYAQEKGLI